MAEPWLNPKTAGDWKKHLDKLVDLFQGRTEGGGATAVALQRFFAYADVDDLKGLDSAVGSGQCVALIQEYVEGIGATATWKPGPRVKDMAAGAIPKGSVIATFWNGAYPTDRSSRSRVEGGGEPGEPLARVGGRMRECHGWLRPGRLTGVVTAIVAFGTAPPITRRDKWAQVVCCFVRCW